MESVTFNFLTTATLPFGFFYCQMSTMFQATLLLLQTLPNTGFPAPTSNWHLEVHPITSNAAMFKSAQNVLQAYPRQHLSVEPFYDMEISRLALANNRIIISTDIFHENLYDEGTIPNYLTTDERDPYTQARLYGKALSNVLGIQRFAVIYNRKVSSVLSSMFPIWADLGLNVIFQGTLVPWDPQNPRQQQLQYERWVRVLSDALRLETRVFFISNFVSNPDDGFCQAFYMLNLNDPKYTFIHDSFGITNSYVYPCYEDIPNQIILLDVFTGSVFWNTHRSFFESYSQVNTSTQTFFSGAYTCSDAIWNITSIDVAPATRLLEAVDLMLLWYYGHETLKAQGRLETATATDWMNLLTDPETRLNYTLSSRFPFSPFSLPAPPDTASLLFASGVAMNTFDITPYVIGSLTLDLRDDTTSIQLDPRQFKWSTPDGVQPLDYFCDPGCTNGGRCVQHQTCACTPGFRGHSVKSFSAKLSVLTDDVRVLTSAHVRVTFWVMHASCISPTFKSRLHKPGPNPLCWLCCSLQWWTFSL